MPQLKLSWSPALWAAALFAMVLLVVLSVAESLHAAGDATLNDSGQFVVLSSQKKIGSERFKIAPGPAGLEATGDIEVDLPGSPHVSESCSLKVDSKLRPVSYDRQQKSPKKGSITVEFGATESKLITKTDAGSETRLFYFPADSLAVLDTNCFHHYAVLLRWYDAAKGGAQHFNVFVPQEATPGTIKLELRGKENVTVGKTARDLNHFEATTEEVKIDIWANPEGQIYRMAIPQANLEVVRQ